MPRKKSPTLTDSELRIMNVLWSLERGSVRDVTEALASEPQPLAYNTVLTMLRILHQKGYVAYEKQGRAFIYTALIGRDQARTSVVDYLISRFFDNSPSLLVQNLLEREEIGGEELKQLEQRIAKSREEDV